MTSDFETILLQENSNPAVKSEPLYDDDQNETSAYTNRIATAGVDESKIDFRLFPLFSVHVQQHLYEIGAESIEPHIKADSEIVEVKPARLDCIAGPSVEQIAGRDADYAATREPPLAQEKELIQCSDCDEHFQSQASLRKHCSVAHYRMSYICTLCDTYVRHKRNLIRHFRNQHPQNDPNLFRKVVKTSEQTEPMAEENRRKRIPRNTVKKVEIQRKQVHKSVVAQARKTAKCNKPRYDNQKEQPFNCPICETKYSYAKNLEKHLETIHPDSQIELNSILRKAQKSRKSSNTGNDDSIAIPAGDGSQAADEHIDERSQMNRNEAETEERAEETDGQQQRSRSVCTICNQIFRNQWCLGRHKHFAHTARSFECFLCHTDFAVITELTKHFRQMHLKKLEYRDYRYNLRACKQCGKEFNDMSLLAKHRRWHKEQLNYRPHKCAVCEKTFIERFELRRHMVQHATTRNFKCEICDKTFKLEKHRKHHMRTHTGIGKVQCAECGIFYMTPHHLRRHMLIHTGEMPFKCEYCGKSFRQSSSLVVHKRSHTGEYIHYCKPCEKGFGARRELRKHNLRVHGLESAPN